MDYNSGKLLFLNYLGGVEVLLKSNEVNSLAKDTVIFQEHEDVTHICIILKGHITAKCLGSKFTLPQGCVVGIPDLYLGKYLCDYVASQDAVIYPFSVNQPSDLEKLFEINKDYQGLMIYSLCAYIKKVSTIVDTLQDNADNLYNFIQETYNKYTDYCSESNEKVEQSIIITNMKPYENDLAISEDVLNYYLECGKIPIGPIKEFFGQSSLMAMRHIEEASGLVANLMIRSIEVTTYIADIFKAIMNHDDTALFKNVAQLYLNRKAKGYHSKELMEIIDLMVDEVNRTDSVLEQNTNYKLPINRAHFEEIYCNLISGTQMLESVEKESKLSQSEILEKLRGSLKQILDYSTLEKEKEQRITTLVNYYINLEDKLTSAEDVRLHRRELSTLFYELYEDVFYVAYESEKIPEVIHLFLNYGFLDERLLSKDQLVSLYHLKMDEPVKPVNVYTIYEWLKLIYEGKKDPSKNEFDQDYSEYIRQLKKSEAMTEEKMKERLTNPKERLHFEIANMFTINNKVVHAQISTFVPFLTEQFFLNYPEKELLTRKRVNESFTRILEIDYSAFYRESLYVNQEAGIEKEYIVKEVFPDIILLPITGSAGSMWQEISGKRRINPGRFMLPIFLDTNIDDIMIRLFGRFRWELCRCIQGTAWNNLKHKSLTSEYMDYLQFYRKNHDLTEDRKEKLKLQIQKARNNSREVFVIDYEAWIKGESTGAIRLNKVVRELLATYCPFSKPIRQKIITQPMFVDAYARFVRNSAKKVHEMELRIHALQKEDKIITKEISDTMTFYRDL